MELDMELLRKIDRIHPYPAKFPIDLAIEHITKYTKQGDAVYDPFVGSGTTLLAARSLGRIGYGTDVNHIAVLISSFKLLSLSKNDLNTLKEFIDDFEITAKDKLDSTVLFSYPAIEHWFCENSIKVLSLIKCEINRMETVNQQTFANLVLSSIINTVSNQESDTRYAAIIKPNLTIPHIIEVFVKKYKTALKLYTSYAEHVQETINGSVFLQDSQFCDKVIESNSIDMILTSPPYPNTYDYYLYHKHRMNWLEYDVKYSMEAEIGSRREYSSLKKPQEKFANDLYLIFKSCNNLLKTDGYVVIVMGDGKIQGKVYEAKENIERICNMLNWKLVDYSYTLLDQTSRAFQQSYRTKGKKEHVFTFRKEK